MWWLLFYDYVPEVLERRGPLRPAHLALLQDLRARGVVRLAGAFAEPVDGAVFVFKGTREDVEAFVRADPYVAAGLVRDWSVRSWNVVVGDEEAG
ncbi:MAG: hypothetical protein IT304_06225 [Dehalococcoidia bacterium]|nr:hypothetical protein [Dehalococcoidia bacterium]